MFSTPLIAFTTVNEVPKYPLSQKRGYFFHYQISLESQYSFGIVISWKFMTCCLFRVVIIIMLMRIGYWVLLFSSGPPMEINVFYSFSLSSTRSSFVYISPFYLYLAVYVSCLCFIIILQPFLSVFNFLSGVYGFLDPQKVFNRL